MNRNGEKVLSKPRHLKDLLLGCEQRYRGRDLFRENRGSMVYGVVFDEFTAGIVMKLLNETTICVNDSLRHFAYNLQLFKPKFMFVVPLFVDVMFRKISAAYKER